MSDAHAVLAHYGAPFAAALADPEVTEVVVNRPFEMAVERAGAWTWTEAPALDARALLAFARAAAALTLQDVSPDRPLCSTVLPGGERCQIVLPPAAAEISLTLRRPLGVVPSLEALARRGLFRRTRFQLKGEVPVRRPPACSPRDAPALLAAAVRARRTILISGPTGSGKTTLARSLVAIIPREERLVTIEDARELDPPHRNRVALLYAKDGQGLAKVGPKALLECALRMRPDRILLQELRDEAAFAWLRSVASGHPGSITTLHAGSPGQALDQLALLVREGEAGRRLTREDLRALVGGALDMIVQVRRSDDGFAVEEIRLGPFD